MNTDFRMALLACSALLANGTAAAHGDYQCAVPKQEMRLQMELQKKLKSQGWKIRMIQTENGCYEVYGFDPDKKRVEAFFDPKTFKRLDVSQ
ncbi:MAG: PepSY domain-containing protein [Steroidobacteraceae bacterium]